MAKAKRRNVKTHPKVRDEEDTDTFVDPSREDQTAGNPDAGRTEVVNIFGGDEVVDTGTVDMNSQAEGDARSMAQEEGSDGGNDVGGNDSRQRADVAQRARSNADSRQEGRNGDSRRSARGDGGEDDGAYSQRVRKRVARERALVNRERALREATQRELGEERAARQQLAERIARIERAQTEVTGHADVKALQTEIAGLAPQIAAATEAGNTSQALALQIKVGELQSKLAVLEYDLRQKQAAAAANPGRQEQTQERRTDTSSEVAPEAAASAEAFKKANRHWWNRSANRNARDDAVTIDREILEELRTGDLDFEPYSDEHWEEVARRLHQTYPDLELQDLDGEAYQFDEEENENVDERGGGRRNTQQQQRGRSPTGAPGQNGRRNQSTLDMARRGQVVLDQEDFNTMRTFKMDTNDPVAKKYMAKEKARSILTGARTSGDSRGNR
jgi:hypothetical protein